MRIIRGKYGKRRFDVPHNITARPTTDFARENIFNVLENIIDFEGRSALDLFAGTGAISYEFLSRGCSPVVAVESAQTQVGFIRSVKEKLGVPVRGKLPREFRHSVRRPPLQPSAIRRNTGNHPRQPHGKTGNDSRSGAFLEP